MYGTGVEEPLRAIDDALVRMRRLWSASRRGPDMSSVLVVEACSRQRDPATVRDVARFAGVEHSTASRLVARAVRAGYVRRVPAGRRVTLLLTPAGAELRARAVAFRTEWLAGVLAGWSDAEIATFARSMGRFADRIGGSGRPGTSLARTGPDERPDP
jgi:DNA-binding MarR family transcriptional regulator